jgi:predicted MFS family arabinose efflux permease
MLRRNPRLRRLLAALAVSQAGDWLYNVALLALVFERTGSPAWVGAATAARVLPMVVGAPLGGVVADRWDRRRVLLASDWLRAGLMAVLALVALTGAPIVLAPLLAAAATLAGAPYPPAVAASTPRLVEDDVLATANAARSAVAAACVVAGPALGAVLLAVGSPAAAFGVNAATFAVSALLVAAIPAGPWSAPAATKRADGGLRAGAVALASHPAARRLAGADLACSFVYGAQTVLLLLLSRRLGAGEHGYGWLLAALGLGGLAGAAWSARIGRHGLPLLAGAVALLALVTGLPGAVALALAAGAGAVAVEVLVDTGLQRELDDDILGRAYGVYFALTIAAIGAGSLAAPVLASALGLSGALAVVAAVPALYAVLTVILATPITSPPCSASVPNV